MNRRLLNLLTALSLLVCVAACVFWARSYWRADAVTVSSLRPAGEPSTQPSGGGRYDGRIFRANSSPGRLVVGAARVWSADLNWYEQSWQVGGTGRRLDWQSQAYPERQAGRGPSFLFATDDRSDPQTFSYFGFVRRQAGWTVMFPYWLAALLTAAPALAWLESARRTRRRRGLDLCPACGYDLRATPGRCPECGMMAPARPAA